MSSYDLYFIFLYNFSPYRWIPHRKFILAFLRLKGFQHGPFRVHIKAQPNPQTVKLTGTLITQYSTWVWLDFTKHYALSQYDINCSLTYHDAFTHSAITAIWIRKYIYIFWLDTKLLYKFSKWIKNINDSNLTDF